MKREEEKALTVETCYKFACNKDETPTPRVSGPVILQFFLPTGISPDGESVFDLQRRRNLALRRVDNKIVILIPQVRMVNHVGDVFEKHGVSFLEKWSIFKKPRGLCI